MANPQPVPVGYATTPPPPPSASRETDEASLAQLTMASKIPSFWRDSPRLWFVQYEAVIANQKMSDASKYNMAISKLSKDQVEQVSDLVLNPPEVKKYETLKARLLAVYEESEVRQVQKLLKEQELGEQKPSQLLRRMRDLARNKFPEDTLRMLWMGHLPSPVRAVLTASEVQDMDKLAVMADKVLETTCYAEVQEVSQTRPSTSKSQPDLETQIATLTRRIQQLERSRSRNRSADPGANRYSFRNRSRSRDRENQMSRKNPNWQCFYHYRYKEKASRCVSPCAWKKQQDNRSEKN